MSSPHFCKPPINQRPHHCHADAGHDTLTARDAIATDRQSIGVGFDACRHRRGSDLLLGDRHCRQDEGDEFAVSERAVLIAPSFRYNGLFRCSYFPKPSYLTSSDTSSSGYGSVDPLPAADATLSRTASMSTRTRLRTKKSEVIYQMCLN